LLRYRKNCHVAIIFHSHIHVIHSHIHIDSRRVNSNVRLISLGVDRRAHNHLRREERNAVIRGWKGKGWLKHRLTIEPLRSLGSRVMEHRKGAIPHGIINRLVVFWSSGGLLRGNSECALLIPKGGMGVARNVGVVFRLLLGRGRG
jgi:hypothetical protein